MSEKQEKMAKFSDWLRTKQLEFINREGRLRTDKEFAEWLAISDKTLSHYLNGRALPANENVIILGNKLGIEIYELVGWPLPVLNGDSSSKK